MSCAQSKLRGMRAHTKMSSKGQVVIPIELRKELGWRVGAQLEVVATEDDDEHGIFDEMRVDAKTVH